MNKKQDGDLFSSSLRKQRGRQRPRWNLSGPLSFHVWWRTIFFPLEKYPWKPYTARHCGAKRKEYGLSLHVDPRYILKRNENKCPHKTCTWMFTAASFTVAQRWRQPECPSVDKWETKCGILIQRNIIWPEYYLGWSTNTCYNMSEPWKHAQWMKLTTGDCMLKDSILMKVQNREICRDGT